APTFVAARAAAHGARAFAVAGRVQAGAGAGFERVLDLGPDGMVRAAELVEERTAALAEEVTS
ncbi:MAG TPA: hypothetical protein VIK95_07705, partial [Egibacteraceae bacterium]